MARQDVTVEMFYNGQWNRVPAYTRNDIQISRGQDNEQSEPTPARLNLTLDDRAGVFNPKNPTSPLYGLAGRNTPIRVTLGSSDVRMVGEIAEYQPGRTEDFAVGRGRGDSWVDITANGVLRRIGQGTDPRSALYRANIDKGPLVYWPMEDGVDASLAASGIPGGVPLVVQSGTIDFESDGAPIGSSGYARVEEVPTNVLSATLPSYTDVGDGWQASIWAKGTGTYAGGTPGASYDEVRIMTLLTSAGYEFRFGLSNNFGGGVNPMFVSVFDPTGSFVSGVVNPAEPALPGFLGGDWHLFEIRVEQATSTTIDLELYSDGSLVDTVSGISCSGVPAYVRVLGSIDFIEAEDIGVAHLMIRPTNTGFSSQWDAGRGYPGETAAVRASALAAERGVGFALVGTAGDSQAMGPQYPDTTTNLLAEAARTDSGLLFDTRDQLGLTFRTGRSLYRQTPALELNFTAGQLAPPFSPVLDDQATRNDVTVQRRQGSNARAVQETGPMNVQDPTDDPQGVGRTVATIEINPATDEILPHHATWHLHLGTTDEIRYPRVTVDLDAAPDLAAAVSAVDIGDGITIANLPRDLSPDLARLLVAGYTERIGPRRRLVTFNCVPASPYDVGEWDEAVTVTSTRWDTDASTTSGSITTGTSTSISVATAAGGALWTTAAGDFPLDIDLLGARVRVTNITGASSPQTFTVSNTVVNGVNKTIPSGTPVRLWQPARWGL